MEGEFEPDPLPPALRFWPGGMMRRPFSPARFVDVLVSCLRDHKPCWLWILLLVFLFSTYGVYSIEDPTTGKCRSKAGTTPTLTPALPSPVSNACSGKRRNRYYHEDIIQGLIERDPYTIGTRDGDRPIIQVKATDGGVVREMDVVHAVSMVIAQLKDKAEQHLGHKVYNAVITVPQHFWLARMSTAMYAARLAGLEVTAGYDDTVAEPFAAAVAHGLHRKLREDGNALVLRVGGGTADASVLTLLDDCSIGIYGYKHDDFLGGDDFDRRMVDHFVDMIKTKHGKDIGEDRVALARLRTACERAKRALSSQDRAQVTVESLLDDGVDFSEQLLRSEFEEMADDLFRRLIALVHGAVADAELEKKMVDEIVLVGGSVVIPKIQKLVKDYFDGKEPDISAKPEQAIALGAARLVHFEPCYTSDRDFLALQDTTNRGNLQAQPTVEKLDNKQ